MKNARVKFKKSTVAKICNMLQYAIKYILHVFLILTLLPAYLSFQLLLNYRYNNLNIITGKFILPR